MAGPILPSATAIADANMTANPVQYQRPFSYDEVAERYPVERVVPPRFNTPIEEEMAAEDYRTKMMARDVGIQGELLNQRFKQKNLEYDSKINAQAEQLQRLLADVNPQAEDFDAQLATIQKQLPIGFQHPAIARQVDRLAQTRNQLQQANEIRARYAWQQQDRDAEYDTRVENELLQNLAQAGPQAIAIYEKNLKPDNTGFISTPAKIKAYAAAAGAIQEAANAQREQQAMTPAQRSRQRIDLINSKNRIMDRRKDVMYQWGPSDDADLQAIQSELDGLGNNTAQGTQPAAVRPPSSYFPSKPSTKTGP